MKAKIIVFAMALLLISPAYAAAPTASVKPNAAVTPGALNPNNTLHLNNHINSMKCRSKRKTSLINNYEHTIGR